MICHFTALNYKTQKSKYPSFLRSLKEDFSGVADNQHIHGLKWFHVLDDKGNRYEGTEIVFTGSFVKFSKYISDLIYIEEVTPIEEPEVIIDLSEKKIDYTKRKKEQDHYSKISKLYDDYYYDAKLTLQSENWPSSVIIKSCPDVQEDKRIFLEYGGTIKPTCVMQIFDCIAEGVFN